MSPVRLDVDGNEWLREISIVETESIQYSKGRSRSFAPLIHPTNEDLFVGTPRTPNSLGAPSCSAQ